MISEEQLALSFTYYFNWGYPDYIKHAFSILINLQANSSHSKVESECSWLQLRQLMDEAETTRIKYLVAGNPNTPASVLDYLSKNSQAKVLEHIALNPRTHLITLKRLAEHENSDVRVAISYNINVSPELLLQLTHDINPDVRYAVAEKSDAPIYLLEELSSDENPYVSLRATKTLQQLKAPDTQIIKGKFGTATKTNKRKQIAN
jgi:hypothetical protein